MRNIHAASIITRGMDLQPGVLAEFRRTAYPHSELALTCVILSDFVAALLRTHFFLDRDFGARKSYMKVLLYGDPSIRLHIQDDLSYQRRVDHDQNSFPRDVRTGEILREACMLYNLEARNALLDVYPTTVQVNKGLHHHYILGS